MPYNRFGFVRLEGEPSQEICVATETTHPVGEYLEHLRAMKNAEEKKLRHLATMKLAQQTRTKFLRMSLEERKVFLDVLTADADGSFTTLFAMQQDLSARGVDDGELELVEATSRGLKKLDDMPLATGFKKGGITWMDAGKVAERASTRIANKKGRLAKPRKGKMPLALPEAPNE